MIVSCVSGLVFVKIISPVLRTLEVFPLLLLLLILNLIYSFFC